MMSIVKKIRSKPYPLLSLIALTKAMIFHGGKIFPGPKMRIRLKGRVITNGGRLFLGFLSNQVGLSPGAKGVIDVSQGAVLTTFGHVRIAQGAKIYVRGKLKIGANTFINPNTLVFARTSVTIGENCAISWDCQIMDDDFHVLNNATSSRSKPISIGDHVLVGSRSTILKGVTIGAGSVIAAGSVVTKNIPAGCLAGGVPAKVLRENITWK